VAAQHPLGYEASLEGWSAALWAALRAACPLPPGAAPDPPAGAPAPPPALRVHARVLPGLRAPAAPAEDQDDEAEVRACLAAAAALDAALAGGGGQGADDAAGEGGGEGDGAPGRLRRFSACSPFVARLLSNRLLTAEDSEREVRHLEFQLGAEGPQFQPGDALAVAPLAPLSCAAALLARLALPDDAVLELRVLGDPAGEEHAHEHAAPQRAFTCAARHLVRGCLDVSSAPPRRTLFALLAATASQSHEAARLAHFGSAAGREELGRYCARERRCLLEVLADFPSTQPPLGMLLQAGPRAHARLFSISSAAAAHPGCAHVTAAVVRWTTPLQRPRTGLLTGLLARAVPGRCAFGVWTLPGALRLPGPGQAAAPLLLVGPGTGVAPFRAFAQQLQAAGAPHAPVALFFGCRRAGVDELYREEWAAAAAEGGTLAPPGGYFAAYSRQGAAKRYVGHLLVEQGARVWALLERGAHVFVAGAAGAMPRDVFDALAQVVEQHAPGMASRAHAEAWLRGLEAQRRYTVECW